VWQAAANKDEMDKMWLAYELIYYLNSSYICDRMILRNIFFLVGT
jgi:hypothetical protein